MTGIYGQESSYGKNDGCKDKGLVNGFGFAQSTFEWRCFAKFTDVASEVDQWLDKQLVSMNINTALCYYNQGKVMNDCDYAHKVLGLIK